MRRDALFTLTILSASSLWPSTRLRAQIHRDWSPAESGQIDQAVQQARNLRSAAGQARPDSRASELDREDARAVRAWLEELSRNGAPADARPGGPLRGTDASRFESGKAVFSRVFTPETGLGPLFNSNSCARCHSTPAVGGAGAPVETHATRFSNGTCDLLADKGGPVVQHSATPALTAATGLTAEPVPEGASATAQRTTTPTFGLGLIEAVPDAEILRRQGRNGGVASIDAQGRVGKFGRKAFFASLFEFNAGAYFQEMGITNDLNPQDKGPAGKPLPAGVEPPNDPSPEISTADLLLASDFTRFLAPPPAKKPANQDEWLSVRRGAERFHALGCASCHTPMMTTGPNENDALDHKRFFPFSDLLLHDVGRPDICFGPARPEQFRTAPLMGLRFRGKLLHDGAAADIPTAIQMHSGQAADSAKKFSGLTDDEKKDLLFFLNSI